MEALPAEQTDLDPALIGREEELKLLRRMMDELDEGRGSAVIVSGDAGIGKTRLMDEVEREARDRGMLFLRGSGDARQAGLAYGVFVEGLKVYLEHTSASGRTDLQKTVAELAPHLWDSLFPDEPMPQAAATADMNPELRQALFLARLGRLLLNLSQRHHMVLCLEDLHWVDSASLRLLNFLAGRNADIPLLILGTYRPDQLEERDGLDLKKMLQELQLKVHFYVLSLEPLDHDRIRALVASLFPDNRFGETLIELLQRKSGGVPLFVVQYLEFLQEKGVLYQDRGLWVIRRLEETQEPDTIRAILRQRLQHLSEEERQVLSYASVQGDIFEGWLVARTLGMPITKMLRILNHLLRTTRLLNVSERKFCFTHAMITEAFYEFLPEEKRRKVHLRLGGILEKQDTENTELLAFHYYRAAAYANALPPLLTSARRAQAAYAYREAQRFLIQAEAAIDGLEPDAVQAQRLELLLLRADIEDKMGDPSLSLDLCRQVLGIADPKEDRGVIARALLQMGQVQYRKADWDEAIKLYWDALSIFGELGDEEKCANTYVRLGNVAFERAQLEEAEARFRDARETAVKGSHHSLLGVVYGNLGVIATVRGQYVEAVLNYTEALKAYRKNNHGYGLCQTYHNLGMAHAARQEWQAALECYTRGGEQAREMGTVDIEANIVVSQAVAQIGVGDLEEAETSCLQARTYMEQLGDRLGLAECSKVEGMICRERSQYSEGEERLQQGRHIFEELENQLGVAECDLELGRLLQDRGEVEAASQHLEESCKLFQEIGAVEDARKAEELLTTLAS